MQQTIKPLALMTLLVTSACGDPFVWDLGTTEDLADDLIVALFLARYDDDSVDIRGPHALGTELPINVIHRNSDADLTGWSIASTDPAVVQLTDTFIHTGVIDTTLQFDDVGEATVEVLNPGGRTVSSETIDVHLPTSAELFASDDIRTGATEPVADDGVLHVAPGSEVSLAVSPLDADGQALTGNGGLSVTLPDLPVPEDGFPAIEASVRDFRTLNGLDFFDLYIEEDPMAAASLEVAIGEITLRDVTIQVHGLDSIDRVELTENLIITGETEPGDYLGTVRGWTFAGSDRVVGLALEWRDGSGEIIGTGTYAQVEEGPPDTATACLPGTEICDEITVSGQLTSVGSGLAALCGCNGTAGSGLSVGLLGLLALGRRRRR